MLRPIGSLFRIAQHLGSLKMRTVGCKKHRMGGRGPQERLPSFWKKAELPGVTWSTQNCFPTGT